MFHHTTLYTLLPTVVPIGTLYYAADVCNDGTKAYLKPNGNTPGCWTDNGVTGTASLTWCGASNQYSDHMTLGGDMTVRVSASYIVTINLPAVHVTLRSSVPPAGTSVTTAATTDIPLTTVDVG